MFRPPSFSFGVLFGALAAVLALASPAAHAQVPLTTEFVGFFEQPVELTAPKGDQRLFVLELNSGKVKIVKDGAELPSAFLDVGAQVQTGGEQGALGLAFHPLYPQNGYVFVCYTRFGGDTVVERYRRSSFDPNRVDPASRRTVLVVPQPFANHNGGCIRFGPDGFLYVGTGDGGADNDPNCNAQNLSSLLGKMLRIDVDAIDSTGSYGIPPGNPFVGWPGARAEVWARGLRNPWRFSFDRRTGDMWIGDVGESLREEVDFAPAGVGGLNFGWRALEGTVCNATGGCNGVDCGSPGLRGPLWEYGHDAAGGCSITGGFRYRGCAIPSLDGTYFAADYCSGKIWSFQTSNGFSISGLTERQNELTAPGGTPLTQVTSIAEDGDGELYFTTIGGGVYKLVPQHSPSQCATLIASPQALSVSDGGFVTFQLDAPNWLGNRPYALLGTGSGPWPGLLLDGIPVPLNPDGYFLSTLVKPNSAPMVNNFGVLTGDGKGLAGLEIPSGILPGSAVGRVFHHAYLALSDFGQILYASPARSLTLIP